MKKLIFIICIILVSCTKTVYVPVERKTVEVVEKRDTVVQVKIEREVVEVLVTDTVAVAQTRYAEARAAVSNGKLSLGLRNKTDSIPVSTRTIYKTVRDSIPYPIEVVKVKKERYVTWYDKAIRWVGGISAFLLILIIIYKILKWRIGLRL